MDAFIFQRSAPATHPKSGTIFHFSTFCKALSQNRYFPLHLLSVGSKRTSLSRDLPGNAGDQMALDIGIEMGYEIAE